MSRSWALPLVALLGACAPRGSLGVKPRYDFRALSAVAVLSLPDAEGLPGSGRFVSDRIAQHLRAAGLKVLERDPIERALAELAPGKPRPLTKREAVELGRRLKADAVVYGRLDALVTPPKLRVHAARGSVTVRREGELRRVPHARGRGSGEIKSYETEDDVRLNLSASMVEVASSAELFVLGNAAERRGFHDAAEAVLGPPLMRLERGIRGALRGRDMVDYDLDAGEGPEVEGWRY